MQNYTYDSLNRLDDAAEFIDANQTPSWRQDFSYDRYGNRNFVEANTTFEGFDKLCANNTELCADLRKVLNPTANASDNRLSSSEGYVFDPSGNTVRDPQSRRFTYDGENKPVKVETLDLNGNPISTVGEYSYDGDGRRIKKHVPSTGEVTVFVYDAAGKSIAEYSTQISQDPKVSYTTSDHLGSPRILTDENGTVISRRDFHPFGEETFTPHRVQSLGYQPDDVRQKFTGYERDIETDLDFAQARMYNKNLGRFNTPDEIFADQYEENPQSWNLYLFVRNNPLNLVDPSGSQADCPPGKVCTLDEEGNVISEDDDEDPGAIETTAPKCSPNNPCRTELPDSLHDWIPAWGSFRQMMWNMRCRETGGCNVNNALWYFGRTALELTPPGWALRGAKLAQAAPSILKTLCFEEGTLILTDTGLKPIEEIREGDKVLSFNEKTKQNEFKTVVQTFERFAEAGRILSVKVQGESAPLGVTQEHPFYVRVQGARSNLSSDDSDGEWVEAGNLRIGDEIRKADGSWASVESIVTRNDGARVYNFEVADNHNYFVGATSLLAHNQCFVNLTRAGKRAIGNLAKHKDELVREVQRARGGKAGAWNAIETIEDGIDYSNVTLGEVANAAARGVGAAERVLKQVKDAARLAGKN